MHCCRCGIILFPDEADVCTICEELERLDEEGLVELIEDEKKDDE